MSILKNPILALNKKAKTAKRLNHINSMKMIIKSIKTIKNHSSGRRYKVEISMKMKTSLISNNRKNNLEVLGQIKITRKIIMTTTININRIMIMRENQIKMHISTLSRVNKIIQSQSNNLKNPKNSHKGSSLMNNNNLLVSKVEREK